MAFYLKWIKGSAVFMGAILAEMLVVFIFYMDYVPFLWLNLIGVLGVFIFSAIIQSISKPPEVLLDN